MHDGVLVLVVDGVLPVAIVFVCVLFVVVVIVFVCCYCFVSVFGDGCLYLFVVVFLLLLTLFRI